MFGMADGAEVSVLHVYNLGKDITKSEVQFYIGQLVRHYINAGDFNAHSKILDLDCIRTNGTGRTIENILLRVEVCLLNPRNFYTYIDFRTGRKSCLYLCVCSHNIVGVTNI